MSLEAQIRKQQEFYSLHMPRVQDRVRRLGVLNAPKLRSIMQEAVDLASRLKGLEASAIEPRRALAAALTRHYMLLLTGRFDGKLEESYFKAQSALASCGRDTRLHIAVNAVAMRSILKNSAARMIWRPFEFAKCAMAMGSLFSFDVSVMLHLQIEMERAALNTRAARMDAEIRLFGNELENVNGSVDTVTGEIAKLAERAGSSASETASGTNKAATSVAASSAALKLSSQSIEELEASIDEIARQAERSAQLAGNAVQSAERSGVSMQNLTAALGDIDSITKLIGSIAAQTNLLALNATIEAARAGEAGRGFAVVAGEVKALVKQVENATSDINAVLQKVRVTAGSSEQEIGAINGVIYSLSDNAVSVSVAVQQQKAAVSEIRDHLLAIIANNEAVNSHLENLVASSAQSAGHSGELNEAIDEMRRRSGGLHKTYDRFSQAIRSA